MNLRDLTDLLQGGNALAHNRNLLWAIKNLLDGNGGGVTSVNYTVVIWNRCEDTMFIKHTPVFFDKTDEGRRIFGGEVGYI